MGPSAVLTLLLVVAAEQLPSNADLLEAIVFASARNYDSALSLLERLCPGSVSSLANESAPRDPSCEIRKYVFAEQRGLIDDHTVSELYWLVGEREYERGELALAEALEELALKRERNDAANWHTLGIIYRAEKKYEKALDAFRNSLVLDPKEPNTRYWLASTLIDVGQLDEAERELTTVLMLDPKQARVWFRRGEILMLRQDYHGAIQAFGTARKQGVPRADVSPKIKECERLLATN